MAIQSVQNSLMNTMTSNVNNNNEKIVDSLGKEYKFADVTAESLKKKQAEEEAQKAEKAKRTGYDKDTFIKLFVAQMKNQDPMEPMKNEEYMTQMAQFTSVEQMSNMASSFEKFAKNYEEKGLNFIGNIEARDPFTGDVDLVVSDGFTGNIFIKTLEGFRKNDIINI